MGQGVDTSVKVRILILRVPKNINIVILFYGFTCLVHKTRYLFPDKRPEGVYILLTFPTLCVYKTLHRSQSLNKPIEVFFFA